MFLRLNYHQNALDNIGSRIFKKES